jgi:hypothetical protein
MKPISALLFVAALPFLGGLGCQAPAQPERPTLRIVDVSDYDEAFDDVLTELRMRDLGPLDLGDADRARGRIQVGPVTSQQWFEFWRKDALGSYQMLEANLQQIGRTITIEFQPLAQRDANGDETTSVTDAEATPSDDDSNELPPLTDNRAGIYSLLVRVDKSRFSTPQRQITTASGALGLYSQRVPTRAGRDGPDPAGHWVPLGRDGLLEEDLLASVLASPHVTLLRHDAR